MAWIDDIYTGLISDVLTTGDEITTRNATVRRLIHYPVEITSTPLVSVRKTAWKNALREWEWFMSGSPDINDLHPSVRPWWTPWADKTGWVNWNYSMQFRRYGDTSGFDQIAYLIDGIKNHPFSRRNVITTWHTEDMNREDCTITNCHGTVIQAFVRPDDSLHLVTYQRSVDVVCGLPHNWLQYWAFLLWVAHWSWRAVGSLTWIGGDVHVYEEHREKQHSFVDYIPISVSVAKLQEVGPPVEREPGRLGLRWFDHAIAPAVDFTGLLVIASTASTSASSSSGL